MIMILRLRVGGTVTVDRDTANSRCVDTGFQSRRGLIQNLVRDAEQVAIVVPVPNSAARREEPLKARETAESTLEVP